MKLQRDCKSVLKQRLEWTEFLATPDGLALLRAFRSIESKALRRAVVTLVERVGGGEELSLNNSDS
jgi:hypothetical protein